MSQESHKQSNQAPCPPRKGFNPLGVDPHLLDLVVDHNLLGGAEAGDWLALDLEGAEAGDGLALDLELAKTGDWDTLERTLKSAKTGDRLALDLQGAETSDWLALDLEGGGRKLSDHFD